MSGFEVAGVVLGAIPLIMSALDGYKTARQYLRFFVRKELLLNQLIWSLKEQKFFIETDVRLALKAADLSEDEIVKLTNTPAECLLKDLDISGAMRVTGRRIRTLLECLISMSGDIELDSCELR
ncbi:uncharacterized protein KD926_007509 [Aspergillus affinis]|uniref:uncharacterized protein n=1 Tax=Aspergillus affinis TaxID=1070780 RepID=UPI0022FE5203|nr:uncharacterized protein KD926_007509 [Aspergillus affinis]KAI9040968.1 hypothetical protein KD926_007509 [Aspergillus affinis]